MTLMFYFLPLFLFNQPVGGCMAGGGQTFICCPPFSSIGCSPSVPICRGYSSYGGSYEAPQQIFYPRPFTYQTNNECKEFINCGSCDESVEEEEEYQKVKIDLDTNTENGCSQQQQQKPCPSTGCTATFNQFPYSLPSCNGASNCNNEQLPLSISDENLPCIDGCSSETNLQINSPCNSPINCNNNNYLKIPPLPPSDSLPIPLPFATTSTEFPIAVSPDIFNQQDYESLDNNELLVTSSTFPTLQTSSFLFPSPVEVSPSNSVEEILQASTLTSTNTDEETTIISPQNPYENNENDKLLEQIITTTISIPTTIKEIKSSSDSLLLNYEDENNKYDNNEILPKNEEMAYGNEAVKKEKLKEKLNTSENEEMKNNCDDTELR
uniref:Candidate secreted effector n=1 Tax=Meloidogyne incognita TaxID=6306 RepID=A0A914MAH4_MELIC